MKKNRLEIVYEDGYIKKIFPYMMNNLPKRGFFKARGNHGAIIEVRK